MVAGRANYMMVIAIAAAVVPPGGCRSSMAVDP